MKQSSNKTNQSYPSTHPSEILSPRKLITGRFVLILLIILCTSWLVYDINVNRLDNSRNFIRALHYYVLQHTDFNIYWTGSLLINYPIQQYFVLGDFQYFFNNMLEKMGHLDQISYGSLDQVNLNKTIQKIQIIYENGDTKSYNWTIQNGTQDFNPFDINDAEQLRKALINSLQISISFEPILIDNNLWDLSFVINTFSDTSLILRFHIHQQISLVNYHILPFILGIFLISLIIKEYLKNKHTMDQFLQYFLCLFLTLTSILSFSDKFSFQFIFMMDGLTCCSAWLCAIYFYIKEDDYKLSFLLTKSYVMIVRLFASFGPLLIAFSLFGYCVFARYSGQFSSFWKTFLSLFYICYYNMTYESAIVTSRSNPISMIFFIVFVLIFTICIYSGMLVSVFCSYVWSKRQMQIKKDITNNLKIECSSCEHKYKYTQRANSKPKKSFNLSQFLQVNWNNPQECKKYKRVMSARIKRLRQNSEQIIQDSMSVYKDGRLVVGQVQNLVEDFWLKNRYINNIIGES